MCVFVQFAFFLAVRMVPFRKQAFFPNLQMSANSILPRREKIAYYDSFETNLLECQKGVFITVRD